VECDVDYLGGSAANYIAQAPGETSLAGGIPKVFVGGISGSRFAGGRRSARSLWELWRSSLVLYSFVWVRSGPGRGGVASRCGIGEGTQLEAGQC
jgi:hypothetical protein